jgi:hypothetical protein
MIRNHDKNKDSVQDVPNRMMPNSDGNVKQNLTKGEIADAAQHPNTVEQWRVFHPEIINKLQSFIDRGKVPHIMFYGPSGSGKRTLVSQFIRMVYGPSKVKQREYTMIVDCARGKGIKFIREQVKFFARTNLDVKRVAPFKSVVLTNADKLTMDAQSALRRLIEIYSHNTRFFVVVQEKNSMLPPILSRLSDMYVPRPIIDGTRTNLHVYLSAQHASNAVIESDDCMNLTTKKMINKVIKEAKDAGRNIGLADVTELAYELYQMGVSSFDVIGFLELYLKDKALKSRVLMVFEKIRSNYRSEEMLMTAILYIGLVRCKDDFHNIGFI